jgi:preprotein translocase subunit SecG
MLHTLIVVIQVLSAIGVIALVLLQHGKGADAGASFGSGASQTVFGSAGSGNFLTHSTAICALIFFSASLGLAHLNKKAVSTMGALDFEKVAQPQPIATSTPASDLPALPAGSAATSDLPVPNSDARVAPDATAVSDTKVAPSLKATIVPAAVAPGPVSSSSPQ